MPPKKLLVVTISVIIGIIIAIGVTFVVSLRPSLPASNNELSTSKQASQIHNTQAYINPTIRQVFLSNSTHINTPYIKEYSMPNGTWPNGILVARNGTVWTVGTKSHTLISFDPKQGKIISSYPIITPEEKTNNKIKTSKNSQSGQGFQMVWSIVEDNDGSIWFSEGGSDPLWRFDPHTEQFQVIHSIAQHLCK